MHDTAQNSSDYFLSQPPDNYHSSGAVCWREGMPLCQKIPVSFIVKQYLGICRQKMYIAAEFRLYIFL